MTMMQYAARRTGRSVFIAAFFCAAGVALTLLSLQNWMLAAAVVYPLLFIAITWRWPHVGLALVLAGAPFQNDLSGGVFAKFSITELNLALTVPVYVLQGLVRRRPFHAGPITVPVLLYFAVCIYASAGNWRETTLISILQMFLYFIIAVMVFSALLERASDARLALNVLVVVGVFVSIVGLATSYRFLGMNKNGMGSSLACLALICLELWFSETGRGRRMLLGVAGAVIVVGLVFSLSRGAWLGTVTGLAAILLLRREFKLCLRLALVIVPLVAICWHVMPQESRTYATGVSRDNFNIEARYKSVDFAERRFQASPIYGMGVGLRKEYDATNLIWMTLAETGVLGLIALTWIHAAFFRMVWRTQRLIKRTDPAYSLLAVGLALLICKLMHGMVDHYWSRGPIMMAWGAVGMATAVYYQVSARQAGCAPGAVPAAEQAVGAA